MRTITRRTSSRRRSLYRTKARRVASKKMTQKASTYNVMPIDNLLKQLRTFAHSRVARYGRSDMISRNILRHSNQVRVQLRKINVVNPLLAKHLQRITLSIRGVSNLPKSVRSNLSRIYRSLKTTVKKDIKSYVQSLRKGFVMIQKDVYKLNAYLKRAYSTSRKGKVWYKVDPSIKRQLISLEKKASTFKTKWDQRLNRLATLGGSQFKAGVKSVKKEIDSLKKMIHQNNQMIAKTTRSHKKGAKPRTLIAKSKFSTHAKAWMKQEKTIDQNRAKLTHYYDQLKAIRSL